MKEETAKRIVQVLEEIAHHLGDLRFGVSHAQRVQRHYDLSVAELRVCMSIVKGRSRKQAAEDHGVAENTLKNQLHQVFQKTGTKTQVELTHLVLGLR